MKLASVLLLAIPAAASTIIPADIVRCPGTALSVPFEQLERFAPAWDFCGGDGLVIRYTDPIRLNHVLFTIQAPPWDYDPGRGGYDPPVMPPVVPPIIPPVVPPIDPPAPVATPEPGTLLLVAAGLILTGKAARRA